MNDVFISLIRICISFVAFKAIIIGSEFSFYYWFKYGKKYTNWYNNRKQFNPCSKEKDNA